MHYMMKYEIFNKSGNEIIFNILFFNELTSVIFALETQ